MAQPTNTFDSYDARGIREDLQDKIYMVSPEATPILSSIRRFSAKNTLHEWQRDSLASPNKDNAVIEADDRTGAALTATERVGNYTQLFDKPITVSDDFDTLTTAGRANEMAMQKAKAMKELKRDVEAMVTSNNVAVAGNSTTARKSAGLGAFIYTNVSHGVGGSTASHTSGAPTVAPTAGTARAFAEAQVKAVMQLCATNTSDFPTLLSLTPSHKGGFSAFTGIAVNRYQVPKGQQGVIVGGADIYMSDFGQLTVVPNYVQGVSNSGTALLVNPEYAGVAYRGGYETIELAKTGHTEKAVARVQCTLVVTNEKAHGKIADLTP